jgi:N-sulfoglucosamine sulfohydrolase
MNEGNHNWIMCLILMICISLPTHAKDLPEKPNFVIVLADDISADSFGCFGSPNPHTTPHIDKLAASGIRFKNMFVSEAMCAPARAELYTGLMPQRNGTFRNHKASNPDIKSMVHYLNDLGYRVGLAGKKHIGPGKVYPFENIDGICGKATEANPKPDDWTGVENFIKREPNQPFCIVIGSIHAHSPWTVGDTSHWKEEEVVLPPNLVDTPQTRSAYLHYLAEVREFDRQVGDTVEVLKKTKQLDHTILIVLDENGAGMPGGKWTVFDWGVRSACVIKCPDSWEANFETDAIAQYCDIVPTLIDAAGGTALG